MESLCIGCTGIYISYFPQGNVLFWVFHLRFFPNLSSQAALFAGSCQECCYLTSDCRICFIPVFWSFSCSRLIFSFNGKIRDQNQTLFDSLLSSSKEFLLYSLFCLRSLIKVHKRLLSNRLCFIPFCLIARNYYTLCTSVLSQVLVLSHWYIGLKNSPLLRGFSVPFSHFLGSLHFIWPFSDPGFY